MFEISYPAWSLAVILLIAVGIGALLYFRNSFEGNKPLTFLLFFLRALGSVLILFLLLNPFLSRSQNQEQPARIIFLQDNTRSLMYKADSSEQDSYRLSLEGFVRDVNRTYPVDAYTFGQEVRSLDFETLAFDEKTTDIREALDYTNALHKSDYVGAMVLATDGIYNLGSNPAYFHPSGDYPVHILAMGDTTPVQDIRVHQILYNEIVRKNESNEIQVDITGNFKQNTPLQVDLQERTDDRWSTISSQSFQPEKEGDFFKTLKFIKKYEQPGIERLRVRISGVKEDEQPQNNIREFFVEVLETARQIHIVSTFPHPDISAIRDILAQNENNEVEVSIVTGKNDLPDPEEFNVLIVYQLTQSPYLADFVQKAINDHKGVILTAGLNTWLPLFNSVQDLVEIRQKTLSPNIIDPSYNSSFDIFEVSDDFKNYLTKFPPLTGIFGEYNIEGQGQALLYQSIGDIETEYPILFAGVNQGNRMALITVEGIWKWRLFEYLEKQETPVMNELLDKMTDYVSQEKDDRLFRLRKNKLLFDETEEINFQAELYNETLERINDPDVFFELRDSSGNLSEYTFDKIGSGYRLNLGRLSPGDYTYLAHTRTGGNKYQEDGTFSVRNIDIELHDLQADHRMLSALAAENGGKVFYDLESLQQQLETAENLKPLLVESRIKSAMIDWRWVFGLILVLFSAEWVIRRFYGGY